MKSPDDRVEENLYSLWTREEGSDKRSLRVSITVAVILHVALLTATFPELYSEELDPNAKERRLFVVETVQFKPKPPPVVREIPKKLVKKVPIPDPEPERPEPFVVDTEPVPEIDLDVDTGLVWNVPEPPAPEVEDKIYDAGRGEIARPERIHYVDPVYTEVARRSRTQGVVVLQAVIDKQGNVVDLEVLRGLSMGLTEEAVKAVRQWRYKPSTVGGRPVDVLLTVTVHFQMQ